MSLEHSAFKFIFIINVSLHLAALIEIYCFCLGMEIICYML